MTPREAMYEKLGAKVVKALQQRHFAAQYCKSVQEARDAALALIGEGETVGWGGSVTINALGLKEALRAKGQPLLDRDAVPEREQKIAIMKQSLTADVFLMSSNAVTADGCLVNMDGAGNRVAALIYGPEKVIVVAGMNKVTATVEDGVHRVRNWAAPMNAQRFQKTVCCQTGTCADCLSPDSICANLVITRLCKTPGRIHVILVGEDLGM